MTMMAADHDPDLDDARLADLTHDARAALDDLGLSEGEAARVVVAGSDFVEPDDVAAVTAAVRRRLTL